MQDTRNDTDPLETGFGALSRLVYDFMACLCDVLACSPYGVPVLMGEGCKGGEEEHLKAMLPGPALRTVCCGGVFMAVNRTYWHDGTLNPISPREYCRKVFEECVPVPWAAEISIAVLRCIPVASGWGGLPISSGGQIQGLPSAETNEESAEMLNSDMLALMLAQEACLRNNEVAQAKRSQSGSGMFIPAPVERFELRNGCSGNIVGWGRGTPLRVHLNDGQLPCESDCLALVANG